MSGPVDEVKSQFTRLLFRVRGDAPDLSNLGRVLHKQNLGTQMEVLVQSPINGMAEKVRNHPGVSDLEESVPSLEDIYAAVMRHVGQTPKGALQ